MEFLHTRNLCQMCESAERVWTKTKKVQRRDGTPSERERLSLPPGGGAEVREMGVLAVWVVGPQGRTESSGRASERKGSEPDVVEN